jgi:histidine ammonia-lyase
MLGESAPFCVRGGIFVIRIDGETLRLEDVVQVARKRVPIVIPEEAMARVERARRFLEDCVREGRVIYGVNTGIGHLAQVRVASEDLEELQLNLVRSHAAGVGPPLADDEVRAILLLKINLFARGNSGVRPLLVRALEQMLARDVLPVIPAKGSLGASGDLAPLAHVGLALAGEGEARHQGQTLPTREALSRAGLQPIRLSYKEGLGVINGCQLMAARGTLLHHDARILLRSAQVITAVVLDVFGASALPFDERVHAGRPYHGQQTVAANLRRLLQGQKRKADRVQDAYSLRCAPQILGGIADAFDDLKRRLEIEVNAASDNPLVFPEEGEVISAGNFHGQSLALGLDAFGTALAEIASLAERQMNRLLNPHLSGLPAFLAPATGRNSGLMILQYTSAALVSENKILAHPAAVDSIPVSADQEDHVSMGATSAHKAKEILGNVANVLGASAMVAAQAMDLAQGEDWTPAAESFRKILRTEVPFWNEDRYASRDLCAASSLVLSGRVVEEVEKTAGRLAE